MTSLPSSVKINMKTTTSLILILGAFLPFILAKEEAVDRKKSKEDKNEKLLKKGTSYSYTLYNEGAYDPKYLHDYKLMINSLIGPVRANTLLVDTSMKLRKDEKRTAFELFGKFRVRIPE